MARAKPQIGKVLLVGLGSGLIAAWTMNQFQAALSKASRIAKEDEPKGTPPQSNSGDEGPEDATLKAAGPIVHYAFGASMGALYSMAAEIYPEVTRGFGTGFGTALFAAGDELAVPLLGLAKGPKEYPLSSHASAFAAHLIYGVTTESIRRASMAIL